MAGAPSHMQTWLPRVAVEEEEATTTPVAVAAVVVAASGEA
jgi:hypothetical protein